MYNQYLNGDDLIPLDDEPEERRREPDQRRQPQGRPQPQHAQAPQSRPGKDLAGEVAGGLSRLLEGVMGHFSLEKVDAGDILLVLIILFLYLEGDDLELVITLGLLLLLGLGDDGDKRD